METYKVTWGNGHCKHFPSHEEAKNFAYDKAFYFTTYIDGNEVGRKF